MTTEKTIQMPAMDGSFNTVKVVVTNERKGRTLGAAIRAGDEIVEETTDHIESENEYTMTFDFGTIRKDRIESLEWHDDGFGATVNRVRFAAFAI